MQSSFIMADVSIAIFVMIKRTSDKCMTSDTDAKILEDQFARVRPPFCGLRAFGPNPTYNRHTRAHQKLYIPLKVCGLASSNSAQRSREPGQASPGKRSRNRPKTPLSSWKPRKARRVVVEELRDLGQRQGVLADMQREIAEIARRVEVAAHLEVAAELDRPAGRASAWRKARSASPLQPGPG